MDAGADPRFLKGGGGVQIRSTSKKGLKSLHRGTRGGGVRPPPPLWIRYVLGWVDEQTKDGWTQRMDWWTDGLPHTGQLSKPSEAQGPLIPQGLYRALNSLNVLEF